MAQAGDPLLCLDPARPCIQCSPEPLPVSPTGLEDGWCAQAPPTRLPARAACLHGGVCQAGGLQETMAPLSCLLPQEEPPRLLPHP